MEHSATARAVASSLVNLFLFGLCPETKRTPGKQPADNPTMSLDALTSLGVDRQVAQDFLTLRKAKRAPLTKSAYDGLCSAWAQAGLSPEAGMRVCVQRGWQGFDPEWISKGKQANRHDLSTMNYGAGVSADGRF